MKIIYPKEQVIKTVKIPNCLLINRFSFTLLKLFLISKHAIFYKIKYRYIKSVIKATSKYKDFEIVNVKSRNGDTVKILL